MNLEILNDIQEKISDIKNEIKQNNHQSEEIELAKKLDVIEEYSVDRFEGDYAILENRKTNNLLFFHPFLFVLWGKIKIYLTKARL